MTGSRTQNQSTPRSTSHAARNARAALGLDFGTSNSTIGLCDAQGDVVLAPVEGGRTVIPSAVFYDTETRDTLFGTDAIAAYVEGAEGRLLRAFKGVLGTDLMGEDTLVGNRKIAFRQIIATYIGHMKKASERHFDQAFEAVVLGRPVCYVDGDPAADQEAQDVMESIGRMLGFKHIEFQFEPIAAALEYEFGLRGEETALVVDIGGGTTDMSLIRLSSARHTRQDRRDDILANLGLRLGGTDFDRLLSLHNVMPFLGYRGALRQEPAVMPLAYYHRLADWKQINSLYNAKTAADIKALSRVACEPDRLEALLHVLDRRMGHDIALRVERAKIALSDNTQTTIPFNDILPSTDISVSAQDFAAAITDRIDAIEALLREALTLSGQDASAVETVFYTGGSSLIPLIRARLAQLLPQARIVQGDAHAAVGRGLCRDAALRFGGASTAAA